MTLSDDVLGFAVALAIGLLIGVERERRKGRGPGREPAGIRTFALASLLGALAAYVGGTEALLVAGGFVALLTVVAYLRSSSDDPGITTEVTLMTAFFLGVLAMSEPALAAGLGVAVAIILTSRDRLHRFVRDLMTEEELHDLLLFAAAAVIVLPLLEDKDVGPWDAVNPYQIWRLVVFVMGVSGVGYIGLRTVGPRFGLAFSGLAGGFVSSSATIASMGNTVREQPALRRAAVAGAVLSTVATMVQMVVVLATTNRDSLWEISPALALGGLAAGSFGVLAIARVPPADSTDPRTPGDAFKLSHAVIFASLLTVITVAAAGAQAKLGEAGVWVSAILGGFADAHAVGASIGALVEDGELAPADAIVPVLLGMTSNTVTKAGAAVVAGGRRFAIPVWAGLALVLAGLWMGGIVGLLL